MTTKRRIRHLAAALLALSLVVGLLAVWVTYGVRIAAACSVLTWPSLRLLDKYVVGRTTN